MTVLELAVCGGLLLTAVAYALRCALRRPRNLMDGWWHDLDPQFSQHPVKVWQVACRASLAASRRRRA